MTADELQRIALRLSNSCWCRFWLHWNYPQQGPWLMAISALDHLGSPMDLTELKPRGFEADFAGPLGLIVYTVERTDEHGNPFRSEL